MVRPLQNLIKKDTQYHWGPLENQAFNAIKKAIIDAPSLMSPNFSQDFTLYTFSSDRSYAAVLTQKNVENNEVHIAFMRSTFKGTKLNYPMVDQQAYAIFKQSSTLGLIFSNPGRKLSSLTESSGIC
jgi:hypothetical protein